MISFHFSILMLIITSSIVIVLVLITRKLFENQISFNILSFMWLIVLARLLIPITLNAPIDLFDIIKDSKTIEHESQNDYVDEIDDLTSIHTTDTVENINLENNAYNFTINNVESFENVTVEKQSIIEKFKNYIMKEYFLLVIIILWIIGASIVFLSNYYSIYNFNIALRSCRKLNDYKINCILNKSKSELNIKKLVDIYECDFIDAPVTCGIMKPKILLPVNYANTISDESIYMIFLHELSHIKNNDIYKNYLWLIVRILYWFNPLVALAHKKYAEDIEYISDNTVIKILGKNSIAEYTQSLIDAVKAKRNLLKVPVTISFCKTKSALRKRVETMLKPQKKSKFAGVTTIMLCIIIIITCFTTACIKKDEINPENTYAENENMTADNASEQTEESETPKSVLSIDASDNGNTQPLKRAPLQSTQDAIDIAQRINISNADILTYVDSFESGIMKVHYITADNDPFTNYTIYDFNGEVARMQTAALLPDELGTEISTEELKQKVIDFAELIYPNTNLIIDDFYKETKTWEIEGVQYDSKDYIADGKLIDNEDNSVRKFNCGIRLDGYVRYLSAEYNGIDYLGLSDDVRKKVLSYAQNQDADIDLYQISDYYGDNMLHFTLGKGMGSVTLLASDMSLMNYLNIPNETDIEFSLNQTQINELIQQYADYYFPGNTGVAINDGEVINKDYIGEGTITDNEGERYFFIQLNGDGKLHKIGTRPNVDKESLTKIDEETARKKAVEEIITFLDFVSESELKMISKEENIESYLFEYKYTSKNPTVYNYSFKSTISINSYTGELQRMHTEHSEEGLNLISEETAIEKAKIYISNQYNLDAEKLLFKEFSILTGKVLEFQVDFNYENGNIYGASMLADTGELDGIGWGASN